MKEKLYIFDKYDNLLAITDNYIKADFEETVEMPVSFLINYPASDSDAEYLVGGNQVAFRDLKGDFRLFTIREVDDRDGEATEKIVNCMPGIQELMDVMVEERRPQDKDAKYVLGLILENARWQVGNVADLGLNSTSFYFKSAYECLGELTKVWGGEIVDRVDIKGNKIAGRYVDIVHRKGSDTGKRFEIDKDIKNITRTVLYYPKTALYGKGKSLQTENEGHTRKITFRDVVWSKKKGDPVDKPKGQEWVGDPEALEKHGIPNHQTGKMLHRFGLFEDNEEEDPEKLLAKTWQAVQGEKDPKAQYEMDIITFYGIAGYEHEQVFLGDTGIARDKDIKPMILIEARIMSWKYDIGNPEDGSLVLGNILDLDPDDSDIDWVIDKVKDKEGNWDAGSGPITDDKFPDVKPDVPKNFKAEGIFQTVMLSWTFQSTYAIAAYEIYASQTNGFAPDKTNLIFRGKVGGYNHKVNTDEKWYYRIRAVNTHGTASEYSEQVSASTVQLDLPDIEDIVPDFIEYGIYKGNEAPSPKDYKYWLDTSKEPNILRHWNGEVWKPLAPTSADELGAVAMEDYQEKVSQIVFDLTNKVDAEWVNGRLVHKANKDDVYTIEQLDNKFDNVVSKTMYETDKGGIVTDLEDHESRISQTETDIQSKVSNKQYEQDKKSLETSIKENKSSIEQNAELIASKVSNEQYKTDKDGIINDIRQNKSSIEQNAKSIKSKVDSTYVQGEIGKIEVGGRNLLKGTSNDFVKYDRTSTWGDYAPYNDVHGVPGKKYTARIYFKPHASNQKDSELRVRFYADGGKYRDVVGNRIKAGEEGYSSVTFTFPEGYKRIVFFAIRFSSKESNRSIVEYKEAKLEKGNKATDWTPAPEDVEAKINNIQVGGRNLIHRSNDFTNLQTAWNATYTYEENQPITELGISNGTRIITTPDPNQEPETKQVYKGISFLALSTIYTWQAKVKNNLSDNILYIFFNGLNDENGEPIRVYLQPNEARHIMVTGKTRSQYDFIQVMFRSEVGVPLYSLDFTIAEDKLEKGNKATDWTPAPEDTQAEIEAVEQYASEIEQTAKGIKQEVTALETDYSKFKNQTNSTIEQQADQIASRVTEKTYNADMDNMTMRVSTAESTIKQNADNIELRVSKDGVVSSINQSPEQIKISAERVSIDGDLVVKNGKVYIKDGVITNSLIAGDAKIDFVKIANVKVTNAMIASITADKIKSGIIDANKVLIRVKNGTQAIQMDDKGFESVDSKGNVRIHIGVRDIAGKGQSDPATIRFFGGSGSYSAGVGMNVNNTFVMGSSSSHVAMELRSGKNAIYYAKQHRFISNGSNKRYWKLWSTSDNPVIQPDISGRGWIGSKSYRMWQVYTNYLYYLHPVKLSTRERKENIRDLLPQTAQQIFDQISIKKYHYINDDGNSSARKESYGPIAEESPYEILSVEGDALLQDNYINVIAGALKFQTGRVDSLVSEIESLKQEIKQLKGES